MKKFKTIFTILLFASIIYSCNNSTGIIVSDEENAKFQAQIETFKTFTNGFLNEDIDLLMSVMADSVQWSPPNYNGNQLIDSDGLRAAGISYFEGFDGITFNVVLWLIF